MKKYKHEYIDLDLPSGIKWATCNLGGKKPEDPGLLFQWSRTDGCRFGDKNHKFIINKFTSSSGTVYKGNEILHPEDDAAHVKMGGLWIF